jgi:hypothetical protein
MNALARVLDADSDLIILEARLDHDRTAFTSFKLRLFFAKYRFGVLDFRHQFWQTSENEIGNFE